MKGKEGINSRNLRLPERTANILKKVADKNSRSVNSEIIVAIERHIFSKENSLK